MPTPPPLQSPPYLFHHDLDAPLSTDSPSCSNLRSLLRTFCPPLLSSSPNSVTLSAMFAALDDPYGFHCSLELPTFSHPQSTFFTPFLSALQLYSSPTSSPSSALLFSHTDALPPHTRYPLPYQVHHLTLHHPAFPALLSMPLSTFDAERSWMSLYWLPLLIDLHHEHVMAGYWLAYYRMDARRRTDRGSLEDAGEGEVDEEDAEGRERRRRSTSGGTEAKAREEGEEERNNDNGGGDDYDADEGELVLAGYVASRVDSDTWFTTRNTGEEGGGAHTAATAGLRVTHVDVENELYDLLQSTDGLQPDFSFAVHSNAR